MIADLLVWSALVPALAAAAVAAAGAYARLHGAAGSLALAVGYAVAHIGVAGWRGVSPTAVTHWLPHAALLCGVLGLAALRTERTALRLAPLLAALPIAWRLLSPYADRLATTTWVAAIAGAAVAMAAHGALWASAARRQRPLATGGALVAAAASFGGASAASGSILLGQLAGAVAACAGGITLLAWLLRRRELPLEPAAACAGVLLGAIALLAIAYSSTPPAAVGLLAAVPAACWLAARIAAARLPRARAAVVQAVLVVALCAGGVVWAAFPPGASPAATDSGGSGEHDYDYGYGYE